MKIKLLELTNFAAIYVGLRRERLRLDFSKFTNIITIMIGEMGTGKTTILSQLHPWSSIGVLDERNSDQLIRTGKDGSKHIVFVDGNDEFDILHKYTWNKDHHSTKSFFKYNGDELNPNGNVSSFKEIVLKMMGVDQSYLRITRLGPNVSNLIDMPWNQRKSYVASMIESVDIYTSILAEIRNMIKTCDAELSTLTKQVMGVSDQELDIMRAEMYDLDKTLEKESKAVLNMYADIQQLSSDNNSIKSKYEDDIQAMINKLDRRIATNSDKRDKLSDKIKELDKGIDINQVMMDIGKYSANIDTMKSNRVLLENRANELTTEITQLENKKLVTVDSSYIDGLVKNYEDMSAKIEYYNDTLKNYEPKLSSAEINVVLSDIRTLDESIYTVKTYNRQIIESIIKNKNGSTSYAKNQAAKLQDRIIHLKRQIANLRFLDGYSVSEDLPTMTNPTCLECPYYKTHPNVVKGNNGSKSEDKIRQKQQEIEECQNQIDVFDDYAVVKSKIDHCTKLFFDIKSKVQKLGALKIDSIDLILLTANPIWYDYDKIIQELELAVNYIDKNNLQCKLVELGNEINRYKGLNMDEIVNQLRDRNNELIDTKAAIKECDDTIDECNSNIQRLNETINDYQNLNELKQELDILNNLISNDNESLSKLESDMSTLNSNMHELSQLQDRFNIVQSNYNADKAKLEQLSHRIKTIEESKKQINALQEKKYVYELIKEASSPQTGIPLLYVQMFLNDCISITNQLISMVLDESVEIMGLDLSKPDMKIPYRKNGEIMEDVKSASQGERAAISLALSFAFMHKCLSMNKGSYNYNILLLDEIDAPFDSSARDKCIQILAQQIKVNNVEQVFFITHNDRYDGYPVNVIATSDVSNIRKDVPILKVY